MAKEQINDDILKHYNNNKYVRIGSDLSVTELMMPTKIVHLRNRHRDEIKEDSLENILPSLIGSATHDGLQRYLRTEGKISGKYLCERRMLNVINGKRIAGRFDILQNNNTILDIKVTRVWKYLFGGKDEWEQQLNVYRWMLHQDGFNIKRLRVMMVLLDWSKVQTWHDPKYPKSRIQFIEIDKWPLQQVEDYMKGRVDEYVKNENVPDNALPKCTEAERWSNAPVFKLYRTKTQKSATKNFDSLKRATAYELKCKQNDPKKWAGSHIKTFRGEPFKRCESWCSVAPWCEQFKNKVT